MVANHECRRICGDLYATAEASFSSFMPSAAWACGVADAVQGEFSSMPGLDVFGSTDMFRNILAPTKRAQG